MSTVATAPLRDAGRKASVNALAAPLVVDLVEAAQRLRLQVSTSWGGATVIDAGIAARGGLEAGRRIAEICLGGLGTVRLAYAAGEGALGALPEVQVHSTDPVLACLASQYAGWSLEHGEGKDAFRALASGPGRALARREPLFEELGYADRHDRAVLVLEVDRAPPEAIVDKIARACALAPERVTLILTPTGSLAGGVQIAARTLEVALHKAHALGFALDRIVDGMGAAPLPPPARDFLAAMGRTNDSILFGARVTLYVDAADGDAEGLARSLPASASRDYGKPFAQIFKDYKFDFYQIDPMLFAPAEATVCNLASGRTFRGGKRDAARLAESFGL